MHRIISIKDIEGLRIGQAEDEKGGTGCTVVLADDVMRAGVDVRGGGPASREIELLKPSAAAEYIHGILLSGGSAFGLNAAGGVMKYLEERGRGIPVGPVRVPLVCQSDIFDLTFGDANIRPDEEMGYKACINSERDNYKDGNFGVGCGATVGKALGPDRCMKSGIGSYAIWQGTFKIGAIVVVNAFGDIYDERGNKIAGVLDEDGKSFLDSSEIMEQRSRGVPKIAANTTLAVIMTDVRMDKTALCKVASMGHNGFARSIRPVHTSMDGDTVYAVSVGEIEADPNVVGTLGAMVVSRAIETAIKSAKGAYGCQAYEDIELLRKI
ncbi:MAG: P1 family peptidase [Lachnospiraceae bacterium]|nr:P1 family peptidase [Lachnospiraceae bacterium]